MGKLVLLTGASGFIAAHVLDQLIELGYSVRGTVRSQEKADAIKKQYPKADLEFAIVKDVAVPGSFDEAVKGVDYVLHVASPFHFNPKDNRELLDPAVQGTKSILDAALTEPKIKRVVITSSFASILDSSKGKWPGHTYTEKDWNPVTWEEGLHGDARTGYRASKKFAEEALWTFYKEKRPHFGVGSVNPPLVLGRLLNSQSLDSLNTSNQKIWNFLSGKLRTIDEDNAQAWVDVEDVAKLHILLMKDDAASIRLFCTNGLFTDQLIVNILRKNFPEYADRIVKGNPANDKLPPLSEHYQVDNNASRATGLKYKSLEQSVTETAKSLIALAKKEGIEGF